MILKKYWAAQGCLILESYDLEKGAGTFNPATFLRSLGPEQWNAAYVELSRRPIDGRYSKNTNRLQSYYQFQVIMKPAPKNIQQIYLKSLKTINLDHKKHDIKFVDDNWESPTLGACGVGWEVWIDGMEVTQFTYFQQIGGIILDPISVEITYGIERLAMHIQNKDNIYDLNWNDKLTYRDIYFENEKQWSIYNFEKSNIDMLKQHFINWETEAKILIYDGHIYPAYDAVIKCSHLFNLLEARKIFSVSERIDYILRIRSIAKLVAEKYLRLVLKNKKNK
jgi:glycyl-tRNA synthetase alpha chain